MKKPIAILLCLMLCLAVTAYAQEAAKPQAPPPPPPTVTTVLHSQLGNIDKDLVSLVEAMPEDKFDFAPTSGEFKGVRTFGQMVKHVASVNFLLASVLLGEKSPVTLEQATNGPDNLKTKAEIVKFLKDSYAACHKAMDTVNNSNVVEQIPNAFNPKGKMTRLGAANIITWHGFDHYGQLVVYLRMNGLVPPASRQG
ncbi:MAG: DinB family protein [Acidobacteriales bacterium]|nr:DinB family protein [Terriglobales bacterium]